MMGAKDALIELVLSLDKGETSYFIKYAKRHGLEVRNDYLWLFEHIKKEKRANWEEIKQQIPPGRFKIGLTKAKRVLYLQILRSMSLYAEEQTVGNQARAMLTAAVFLKDHGLNKQFVKQIRKAKKLAQDYQEYSLLHHISTYEWEIILNNSGTQPIEAFYENQLKNLATLKEEEYVMYKSSLMRKAFLQFRKIQSTNNRKEVDAIMEDLEKLDFEKLTLRSKQLILYYQYHYYALVKNDLNRANLAQLKSIQIYQESPHLLRSDPTGFIISYYHVCYYYLLIHDYEAFNKHYALPNLTLGAYQRLFLTGFQYLLKLLYFLRLGDKDNLNTYMLEAKKWMITNKKRVKRFLYRHISIALIQGYYLLGHYRQSIDGANNSLQEIKAQNPTMTKLLLILLCFSYFKLKEISLLESTIFRFEYFIKERKDAIGYDFILLESVRVLLSGKRVAKRLTVQLNKYKQLLNEQFEPDYAIFDLDRILEEEIKANQH